jgi:hypothetical protein
MLALAASGEEARHRLVRDVEHCGLPVLEVANEREVLGDNEVEQIAEHLAANLRALEPEAQTVRGILAHRCRRARPPHHPLLPPSGMSAFDPFRPITASATGI